MSKSQIATKEDFPMSKVLDAFTEKLEKLEHEIGCPVDIVADNFNGYIESNTLFAGWFEPGTLLAVTETKAGTLKYEVEGSLDAVLVDKDGTEVHTFKDAFQFFDNGDVVITDDKDIEALADGKHPSGYTLKFNSDNRVKAYVAGSEADAVYGDSPSVARCILNKDLFISALSEEEADKARREEALKEAQEQIMFDQIDPPAPPEPDEADDGGIVLSDIPHYSETEEGKAELAKLEADDEEADDEDTPAEEPEEKPKKTSRKSAKKDAEPKETKSAKPKAKDKKVKGVDESARRFDLLPLDYIEKFIAAFDNCESDADFLTSIEEFKAGKSTALDAAACFAKASFEDAIAALFAITTQFEIEADEDAPEEWKQLEAIETINIAIKAYLLSLRGTDEEDSVPFILKELFCAAWLVDNGR